MTNNVDAQIARQWAEAWAEEPTNHLLAAVRRHILATTTPPTMADVEWDDDVHAGLCAESTDDGVVRMIGPDWVNDRADHILCRLLPGGIDSLPMSSLIPLPGTRLDLAPRREQVSGPTPDHPAVLITEEDYRNAPAGTVAAADGEGAWTWTKGKDGLWEAYGTIDVFSNFALSGEDCRVLRWGWEK